MTLIKTMKKTVYALSCALSLSLLVACSSDSATTTTDTASSTTTTSATSSSVDWESLPTTEVSLTESGLTITEAGTYILSGTTTSGVTVNSTGNVRIILNGATISNTDGAGINVVAANNTYIELASGTQNTVSDSASRSDQTIEGAIYSADDLFITGEGQLTVTANFSDGIVSKDDLTIEGGEISVSAADDGIRGKDSVEITGGTIAVTATNDGIKSTNDMDTAKGYIHITGGKITVNAGDQAFKAVTQFTQDGGQIVVDASSEGIEASQITINGGETTIHSVDDGVNASADGLTVEVFFTMTGGTLNVSMSGGDSDAIDSNGNITVSGGEIAITGFSGFDYDGTASFTGGTITINGEKQTEIVKTSP